jgi:hypothetical protein
MKETALNYAKTGYRRVFKHWTPTRFVVGSALIFLAMIPCSMMLLGIENAYTAASPSAIVPADLWMRFTSPDGGFDSLGEALFALGFGVPMLAAADFAGRFAYAHLLWVPPVIWRIISWFILAAPAVWIGGNIIHTFGLVFESDFVEEAMSDA